MTRAVFFDLYHTLIRYEPSQEKLQAVALKDYGIDMEPEVLRRALVIADEFIYGEMARVSLSKRSEEDRMALWVQYEKIVLKKAGVETSEKLVRGVLGKIRQVKTKLMLFDDVVPALTGLNARGLILGLISNVDNDITTLLNDTGLQALLQIIVTSREAGFNKPQPEIFQEALRRAGVRASEAIYVGDQYQVDIVGAAGAGMRGVLLDRVGGNEARDCPRIQTLAQVIEHL